MHKVILHNDGSSSHPACFAQQDHWVVGVVKDINHQHRIHAMVGTRKYEAVKLFDRDIGVRPKEHVDPRHAHIRSFRLEQARKEPIATPDVKELAMMRKARTDLVLQRFDASRMNQKSVKGPDRVHGFLACIVRC